MDDFTRLRRELHANPELSGDERQTARRIVSFFRQLDPDHSIEHLGGNGLALVFDGRQPGPRLLFRCELDAVAVHEENRMGHLSQNLGVSHKCGHDGHMAIMAHFGHMISQRRPTRGCIILLFQPAEETGQGAAAVVEDPRYKALNPDFAFALHNLPGYPLGSIVLKSGPINYASRGMTVCLSGRTSHAAWPEEGVSPALPMAELIQGLAGFTDDPVLAAANSRVTVVNARLGEPAFGLSPGYAEIRATLRAETDEAILLLAEQAVKLVQGKAKMIHLGCDISWSEEFAASVNDAGACDIVRKAAGAAGRQVIDLEQALRVSEDFGQFSSRVPGVMFGLGAGEKCPGLPRADYEFPEALIEIGSKIFMEIVNQLLPGMAPPG